MQQPLSRASRAARALLLVTAAGLLAACEAASPEAIVAPVGEARGQAAGVSEVSGHTTFTYGEDLTQTTSFHAQRSEDGVVAGTFELNVHGASKDFIRGDVTCLLQNGNEAILAGPVTGSSVGATSFWMRVRDNGEGANAAPDQWSDLIYSLDPTFDLAARCATYFYPGLFPVEGGNIQVR
jgi:hypothetical protein